MFDAAFLEKTACTVMPYGKYQGRLLHNLPDHYIVWMKEQGFPKGELGEMLSLVYEVKLNGLEHLLREIARRRGQS